MHFGRAKLDYLDLDPELLMLMQREGLLEPSNTETPTFRASSAAYILRTFLDWDGPLDVKDLTELMIRVDARARIERAPEHLKPLLQSYEDERRRRERERLLYPRRHAARCALERWRSTTSALLRKAATPRRWLAWPLGVGGAYLLGAGELYIGTAVLLAAMYNGAYPVPEE